jgi:glycosyltransferase involved in cell wall biosynthesis
MFSLKETSLTLFFTGGVGLKTWDEVGNLDRETAIYKKLSEHLREVNFVTYGGESDLRYSSRLGSIKLHTTRWRRFRALTLLDLLSIHWRMLRNTTVLKTNQILGSDIPVWLKRRFNKKLIVRCGYPYARASEVLGRDKKVIARAYRLERSAFEAADLGVVPTIRDRDWIVNTHNIPEEKMRVIPNYVDTEIFKPANRSVEIGYDLIYIGRSGYQKNLMSLLESLALLKSRGLQVRLILIGGCADDKSLKVFSDREGLSVTFRSSIPNQELPTYLHMSSVFILPSIYEGHPKVLLEAMSCGLPCIGTEVEGIREILKHRETGYLCGTDPESIADAIKAILSDEVMRRRIGEKARSYIMENFTLERVLDMELTLIRELVEG